MSRESPIFTNKQQARIFFSQAALLSAKRKKQAGQKALKTLLPIVQKYSTVLSFAPTEKEINLWPLNKFLLQQKKLALPKTCQGSITPFLVSDLAKLKPHHRYGILEPQNSCPEISIDEIKLVLVPALAFDQKGKRLGRGQGYYDRFLKQMPHAYTIGVGFQEMLASEPLPAESHDMAVKAVLLF